MASATPEMHQAKKGTQRHFGVKAHVGVEVDVGLAHSVIGTAANVNDVTQANALLNGEEKEAVGDAAGYHQGAEKRPDATGKVRWTVAMRLGKRRVLDNNQKSTTPIEQLEDLKGRIRTKVEHPFRAIKHQCESTKVGYRALAKIPRR